MQAHNKLPHPVLLWKPYPLSCLRTLTESSRVTFGEICEGRYQTRSTILTSQLPVTRWHEQIGDPTAADGILDRPVHNAHRLEMRGDSMRKKRGTEPSS
jgi:DNA replication protein DnaC